VTVFVDTSAFLAILDADDARHGSAADAWTRIVESEDSILTSNYVVLECIALLHSRFGTTAARRFVEDMTPAVEIAWVDRAVHDAAVAAALAGPGKGGPSLVDCVSFELIRRLGVEKVLAYDRHFRSRGYDSV
jgi:predicted nucleic acid-binding protein